MAGDAFQEQPQFFQTERFGDVIIGAIFHRLHRRLDRAVAGHYDDDCFRVVLADGVESLHTARAGQFEVEQDHVRASVIEDAVCLFSRLRHLRVEAKTLRHRPAGFADGAVVVHD